MKSNSDAGGVGMKLGKYTKRKSERNPVVRYETHQALGNEEEHIGHIGHI